MCMLWSRICIAVIISVVSLPSEASDYATQVMQATFKLFNKESTGTCILFKRSADDAALYLVTAAHVLEKADGDKALLVLRKKISDDAYERLDVPVIIRKDDKPIWIKHPKHDLAIIRLTQTLPIAVTPLSADCLAKQQDLKDNKIHICSSLFILTYPQRFEANSAGFPVARQGIWASPPELPVASNPTFLADFTTFAGDSGGPVFMPVTEEKPLILGFVLSQNYFDDRMKSTYEERLVHYPLGMGTVLHAHYARELLADIKPE